MIPRPGVLPAIGPRVGLLVGLVVAALVLFGLPGFPAEAATVSPAPTPSSPGSSASPSSAPQVVVAGGPDVGSAAIFEVQDFSATSEGFGFAEASSDGAVVDTGGRDFRLASDVLFAFDKATLTRRARTELAGIAAKLKEVSAGGKPVTTVRVTGYTDSVGGDGYNLRLSRRRAEAVRAVLGKALGSTVTVTSAGRGEAAPIAKNSSASGRKANRRVEIRAG